MQLEVRRVSGNVIDLALRAERRRPGVLRRGLRKFGNRFKRRAAKEYFTGAGGLRRVTGSAARGWHHLITGRGLNLTLHVWNNVPYVRFHVDDYEPLGSPRRHEAVVKTGDLWEEMLDGEALLDAFDDAIRGRR